jgi:hypothetical protein
MTPSFKHLKHPHQRFGDAPDQDADKALSYS